MATLILPCYDLIKSCVDCSGLIQEGETVYVATIPDRFSDPDYPGYVQGTVTSSIKECDNCYSYVIELLDVGLPAGIANLSECDVVGISCDPESACVEINPLTITAGTSPDDISGGSVTLPNGGNIHIWSETLQVTVVEGSAVIRIETSSPYAFGSPQASW